MFKAQAALLTLCQRGIPHVVTSTKRTLDEQKALYAQGRQVLSTVNELRAKAGMRPILGSENLYTVTRADGVVHQSNHQGGLALDVVPAKPNGNPEWPFDGDPRWKEISDVM